MVVKQNGARCTCGRRGCMEAYAGQLSPDDIWSIVSWIRAQQAHEGQESPGTEAKEHQQGGKH